MIFNNLQKSCCVVPTRAPRKMAFLRFFEVLFTLLAHRYERGSVMITSNLPFSKWETIFKDPVVTAAAIDRLVHHCVILELNVESFRMAEARKANLSQRQAGKIIGKRG